jgi:hypothetical protein
MMGRRALALGIVAALWILWSAPPALAQDGTNDDLVVMTGRVDVAEGESFGDVVIFDGPVGVDGEVTGDVVAFNGDVNVSGTVEGDVLAFNGGVTVASGANVGGDIRSRSSAEVSPDADVGGDVGGLDFRGVDFEFAAARYAVWAAISASALALILIFLWLFPRAADATAIAGRARTGAAIGWGLLWFFGIPILSILLLVTLIGIPLGIALLLALALIYSLGYTIGIYFVGRSILGPPRSRALAALVGLMIVRAVALIPFLGGLTWFALTVFGLGLAAVTASAGKREGAAQRPASPPPPPAPA